jgi:serine protease Do
MDELPKIIESLKPSIIVIKLANGGRGSGFFVNDRGLLISNKHTVGLDTFIKVGLHDGKEVDGTVVYADNDIDFSLVVAQVEKSMPLAVADSDQVKEGEQVLAIGHPYGYDFTVSKGIVSCKSRVVKGIRYIQTDVPINPGNSGGPLINTRGEVVGINSWVVGEADNMSFAIPANSVRTVINDLVSKFDKLLSMYYCPYCGFLMEDFIKTSKADYCKNCGSPKFEKKRPEAAPVVQPEAQAVKVSMKICPKCQAGNDASANFCKNCGSKFS